MAKLEAQPTLKLEITLLLNETEARALCAVASYGTEQFLEVFYAQMGRAYLEPHVAGIHSLFNAVMDHLPTILTRMKEARGMFVGARLL